MNVKQSVFSKWLFHYERREKRSPILWIVAVGAMLAVLCVFGGLGAVQGFIERTEELAKNAPYQTGTPFFVRKYSPTQMLVLQIAGVKYQLLIALALITRWFGLFAYGQHRSARWKWVTVCISEVSLILAIATFGWYSWVSYKVLHLETVCTLCMSGAQAFLGSTVLWTSVLAFVMLVQTVYGIARLIVPLVDIRRVTNTTSS